MNKKQRIDLFRLRFLECICSMNEQRGCMSKLLAGFEWAFNVDHVDNTQLYLDSKKQTYDELSKIAKAISNLKQSFRKLDEINKGIKINFGNLEPLCTNEIIKKSDFSDQLALMEEWCDRNLPKFKTNRKGRRKENSYDEVLLLAETMHRMIFDKEGPLSRSGYYLSAIGDALTIVNSPLSEEGIVTRIQKLRKKFNSTYDEMNNIEQTKESKFPQFLQDIMTNNEFLNIKNGSRDEQMSEEEREVLQNNELCKMMSKFLPLFTKNPKSS